MYAKILSEWGKNKDDKEQKRYITYSISDNNNRNDNISGFNNNIIK